MDLLRLYVKNMLMVPAVISVPMPSDAITSALSQCMAAVVQELRENKMTQNPGNIEIMLIERMRFWIERHINYCRCGESSLW